MEPREGTVVREISRYNYPDNLDLRPRSPLSQQICARIIHNATASHDFMSKKYEKWREIDRKNHAYIPVNDEERLRRIGQGTDPGDNRIPMSMTFPYMYSLKKSMLAHLTARNLRGPLHKLTGHGLKEDMLRAQLLAVVINQEANYYNAQLTYHQAYECALDYGVAFVACNWHTDHHMVTREIPGLNAPIPGMLPTTQFNTDWEVRFEGSKVKIIDPYRALPDPRVALEDVDEASRFQYLDQEGLFSLIAKDNRGELFNIAHLRESKQWTSTFMLHNSNRGYIRNVYGDTVNLDPDEGAIDPYESTHPVCIKGVEWIIPREYPGNGLGVGTEDYPVLYEYTIGADEHILQFERVKSKHGMLPIATGGFNVDGFSLTPTAPAEFVLGPQEFIDWSANSYVTEAIANINGRWIYDPLVIREDDVNSKKLDQKMRLRQRFWGQGKLKEAFHQLTGTTYAQQHIQQIPMVQDFMNRGYGASEILQGVRRNSGERQSATESEGIKEMGLSRVDEMSFLMKLMLHKRLTRLYAENCIENKSQGGWHRALDDWPDALREEFGDGPVWVDPQDINIPYDAMIEDDADSMGSEASTAMLVQLLGTALSSEHPEMEQVSPIQWMKVIARRAGERNVQRLFRQPPRQIQGQVMDDEQLDREVEAGNQVPIPQALGGGGQLALPAGM